MRSIIVSLLIVFCGQVSNAQTLISLKSKINLKHNSISEASLTANLKEEKSGALAFLYSFLIPGMGELYAERYDVGVYFTAAEGVLWLGLSGLNYYGNWQRDNYKDYAAVHAGIDLTNKSENYFATISSYLNINDYNNEKYLNREFHKVLDLNTHYWNWPSNDARKKYRSMWVSSESAFNNVRFAAAMIVVNHLVSAINAVILTNKYNRGLESSGLSFRTGFEKNIFGGIDYKLNLTTRF